MIAGAIFDMDGVLVDNAHIHIRAWKQLGKELGKELTDEAVRRVFGQRNKEMLAALVGDSVSEEEEQRRAARKEELYRGFMAPELAPVPGLLYFLAQLKEAGIKTAIATSGPQENVELVLQGLSLQEHWDAVVMGADVSRSKPAPDIFLLAARRLQLAPDRCVVFEDSTAGLLAAVQAGCPCIALATTHRREELEPFSACRIIPDFTHLRAADLQDLTGS